jgi:Tol biopolymer transport system component
MGWMVRESLENNAAFVAGTVHGDGLTSMQNRKLKGATMSEVDEIKAVKKNYEILQLERAGNLITMRAAKFGEPFDTIGTREVDNLSGEVYIGLFVCSHDENVLEEAKVWNVRIDKPVADTYNPNNSGWLGCRLETMNVFDGKRKVILTEDSRFEAPNWMPDGKNLLINKKGLLYKIPVNGGDLQQVNTGFADNLNNDHGISFDGKMLAISHHRKEANGGSAVYVLPIEGGTPKLITEETPSYWHGWAPNNKEVVYVAMREGKNGYNIYKKSIDGGEETDLTSVEKGVHVDGCEYSPDGKYIYYNGSHTGTMQIWRMKPDGSEKEQITFDAYNDWFPHISPDGKWIAFISFPETIPVNDHPSYKRVLLRLLPITGGEPKVIAYLYGGQGTINVPSWSPDSKKIAFVSNF